MSALLVGMMLHGPLREAALSVIRFPFTLTKTAVVMLVTLPRLPWLAGDNSRLHTELVQQQVETAQLRELLRHTQQAQALLSVKSSPQGIVASVVDRSTVPTQHTVLLDHGRRHGLTEDTLIMDASGVIGRVTELHPDTCLVTLLTDPESRVAGMVERSREIGLLVGRGEGTCELIYLDVHADVEVGDRIVTAGLSGPFPKGLLLGTVTRVTRDEQSWAAWASVKPAAHFGRLEEVLCLPAH